MVCERPYMLGVMPCGCGQCDGCRVSRRRVWVHRMLLESWKHGDSCFVTLTYDDEHLPKDGSLEPVEAQRWLKRLRKVLSPEKVRFFLVGEYGDKSERPHYHAVIFGLSSFVGGGVDGCGGVVAETWQKGFTFVGEFNEKTAAYVSGYVLKKLTRKDDKRLKGRFPEFARMSLRPGLGRAAMADVARCYETEGGVRSLLGSGDVSGTLLHGLRRLPLGSYLRRGLREEVGFGCLETPEIEKRAYAEEMRKVFKDALSVKENSSKGLAQILVDKDLQKLRNVKARLKLWECRREL